MRMRMAGSKGPSGFDECVKSRAIVPCVCVLCAYVCAPQSPSALPRQPPHTDLPALVPAQLGNCVAPCEPACLHTCAPVCMRACLLHRCMHACAAACLQQTTPLVAKCVTCLAQHSRWRGNLQQCTISLAAIAGIMAKSWEAYEARTVMHTHHVVCVVGMLVWWLLNLCSQKRTAAAFVNIGAVGCQLYHSINMPLSDDLPIHRTDEPAMVTLLISSSFFGGAIIALSGIPLPKKARLVFRMVIVSLQCKFLFSQYYATTRSAIITTALPCTTLTFMAGAFGTDYLHQKWALMEPAEFFAGLTQKLKLPVDRCGGSLSASFSRGAGSCRSDLIRNRDSWRTRLFLPEIGEFWTGACYALIVQALLVIIFTGDKEPGTELHSYLPNFAFGKPHGPLLNSTKTQMPPHTRHLQKMDPQSGMWSEPVRLQTRLLSQIDFALGRPVLWLLQTAACVTAIFLVMMAYGIKKRWLKRKHAADDVSSSVLTFSVSSNFKNRCSGNSCLICSPHCQQTLIASNLPVIIEGCTTPELLEDGEGIEIVFCFVVAPNSETGARIFLNYFIVHIGACQQQTWRVCSKLINSNDASCRAHESVLSLTGCSWHALHSVEKRSSLGTMLGSRCAKGAWNSAAQPLVRPSFFAGIGAKHAFALAGCVRSCDACAGDTDQGTASCIRHSAQGAVG